MRNLTPAEKRIIPFVAEGLTTNQIAARLGKSHSTIKTQLQMVYIKCGARNRIELLRKLYKFSEVA